MVAETCSSCAWDKARGSQVWGQPELHTRPYLKHNSRRERKALVLAFVSVAVGGKKCQTVASLVCVQVFRELPLMADRKDLVIAPDLLRYVNR